MAFSANRSRRIQTGYDVIPITPSATTNVFGETFNTTNGPASAARACDFILASAICTINCITAAGISRTSVPLQAGINQLAVIQVSSVSTGSLFAGIVT